MKKCLLLLFLPSVFMLSACSAQTPKAEIVTSFYPMTAFTKAIVGDTVTVRQLVPPAIDIHDYEPSAQAVAEMTSAKAVVYNSDNLETWVRPVSTKAMKIEAADHIKVNADDPHTWLSPKEAIVEVEDISSQLQKAFPQYASLYKANTAAYVKKLQTLSQQYEALRQVKQKIIITQHDAFSYLAHDYGLTNVPIAGLDPDNEPSPNTLSKLEATMKKYQVKTVFFEKDDTSKVAETLAQSVNAQTVSLNTLETTQPDANYIALMQKNLQTLEKVLN